ncbi:MAG: alkaline phosphatase family protein [Nostocaceae cyanobacterium]|nr:alkaline phosphatase family protein [Nostocaceae cyanobacterium]
MNSQNLMQERIKRVVVIMLENRSFDSVLGYLYSPGNEPQHHIPALAEDENKFHGLAFVDTEKLNNTLERDGKTYLNLPPAPTVRASNSPGLDPHEDYRHVNVQLFGYDVNPLPGVTANMKGFLKDYASHWSELGDEQLQTISQIMRMYTPTDLPVLNALAKGYAVSDMWFSSAPTQTNANRAFSLCGTSLGLVDNGFLTTNPVEAYLADDRFDIDTIWHVLEQNNFHDWGIFWDKPYPPLISSVPYTRRIFPRMEQIPFIDAHFYPMEKFFEMAEAGTLPTFSYIEPSWGGTILGNISILGNDFHPPSDVTPGEEMLKRIYLSLVSNKAAWEETLLLIVFDEHGGTYDHVPPPRSAKPPWGFKQPNFPLQHDFDFQRFGVRVPCILVSPYIEQRTVFRSPTQVPYDHTSIIATILEWRGIDRNSWGLGERVANAPTFCDVFTCSEPRTDNIFAAPPSPAIGTPLKFGAQFCLRHRSGEYISKAYSGVRYYFPQLGTTDPVKLELRYGEGEVQSGATVQIRTEEYLQPLLALGLGETVGIRNFLGAWRDESDCYYYSSDDAKNYQQQYWQITKADGSEGDICYGDRVHISSKFTLFQGQQMIKNQEWISTSSNADDWWIIAPPPESSPDPDVIKYGDTLYLRHMSDKYIITAELGKYNWSRIGRTGQVKLQICGGIGDLISGTVIKLKSTEEDLGRENVLGAFGDSHDCYYWYDGYDLNKQGWKITKADTSGDSKIRYGDKVYITNLAYPNQNLVLDTDYPGFVTTAEDKEQWWIFQAPPPPQPPETAKFGDKFYLKTKDGKYLITAEHGRYSWPRLSNTGQVKLEITGGSGELTDGTLIHVKSTEEDLGEENMLGAFGDSRDCYYWQEGYDEDKQGWEIAKVEANGDNQIHYGEKVYIINRAYRNQKLTADSRTPEYVTTQADTNEWWILEKDGQ